MPEYKHVPMSIKAMTEDGIAEFMASVFGNVDLVNDVVVKGAFAKSLAEYRPKFVADHNRSIGFRLGKVLDAVETDEGLHIKAAFNLNKQFAREVFSDFKFAPEDQEFSFAYEVPKGGSEVKDGIRYLKEVNLLEVGPVLMGANPATRLMAVKELAESLDLTVAEKVGRRNNASDATTIQQMHDMSVGLGAECDSGGGSASRAKPEEPEKAKSEEPGSDRIHRILHAYPHH